MMLYVFITMLTALSISVIAIYYSVAGLVAIFAGAAIPIIIMGGILETAKLVTAVWLHRFWEEAPKWLRYYLLSAVIVLMLITSMGIFGFLSKAHIEQTGVGTENVAMLQQVNAQIARNTDKINSAEANINRLKSQGTSGQASLQAQIDREQERIDAAYARIQPLVAEQQRVIYDYFSVYQSEIDKIDVTLDKLQSYIDTDDISKAQALIGTKVDGKYGDNTAAAFNRFQDEKRAERSQWLDKIEEANTSYEVTQAREEINRLRNNAEKQIQQSQALITEYTNSLRTSAESRDVTELIQSEQLAIESYQQDMAGLITKKYTLESEARQLEIEVGPVKYIAELIYGSDTTFDLLEEAVRWVIIVLIFVFDPLAVLLLIASQYSLQLVNPSYRSIFDIGRGKQPTEEYVDLRPIEKNEVRTDIIVEKKESTPAPEISKDEIEKEPVKKPKATPAPKRQAVEQVQSQVQSVAKDKPVIKKRTVAEVEAQKQQAKQENVPQQKGHIDVEAAKDWINVNIPPNRYKQL